MYDTPYLQEWNKPNFENCGAYKIKGKGNYT